MTGFRKVRVMKQIFAQGGLLFLVFFTALFATTTWAAENVDLTVVRGDTLWDLCRRHLEEPRSCQEVYRVNRLANPDLIRPGQHLKVPAVLLRGVPEDGTVTFVKGEVSLLPAGGEGGRRPLVDDRLKEGERLVTGADGIVEVAFADGTSLLVRGNSSLTIVRSRDKGGVWFLRELYLKAGRVLSRIRNATGRGQRFNIRTPAAVAGARGTEFRVAAAEDGLTRSEVLEGTVAVAGGGREMLVHEGEGTLARKGAPPLPPVPLLPPPAPADLLPVYRSEPLRLRFSAVPEAVSYRVMFSRDPAMKDLVREEVILPPAAFEVKGVEDGAYHLQVLSIDRHGLEGTPSAAVPVKVRTNPRPPLVQSPRDGAELRENSTTVQWLRVGDAKGYRLQVDREGTFTAPLIDELISGKTERRLGGLQVGGYRFRIASVAEDGFEGEWSDPLAFVVVPPPPVPVAEKPEADRDHVRFRVRSAGSGFTYRFQVARDGAFAQMIHDVTPGGPELVIPRPAEPGTYHVRTKTVDAKGYESSFSSPQSFEIPQEIPYGTLGVIGAVLGLIILLAP
ncbi:MAG: LysM peptidoglycan-binding domain-containing protein [Desulfuromonadales bacterium]|nr:MAG: LysM peptidoglycan-binding domain-containing protein [Desulfuromonadales bacterium]